MRIERADETVLFQYLLGSLSEEEQAQVEDRAFADADYLVALEDAEADLIDTYVRGGLSQADRRQFEHRFFTSPQRRDKVEFARALARVTAEEKMVSTPAVAPRRTGWQSIIELFRGWNPAFQAAAAMAAMVLIAAVSWLSIQNAGMHSRLADLAARQRDLEARDQDLQRRLAQEQGRAGELAAQLQNRQAPANTPLIASLVLLPGLSRAETRVAQLVIQPGAQLAHIEIQLEERDDFPRFRADLHTRAGADVLVRGNLTRRRTGAGYAVAFDVPAGDLAAGDYELALKGVSRDQSVQDIGFYYFRVQK